jgi:hypothetical protein
VELIVQPDARDVIRDPRRNRSATGIRKRTIANASGAITISGWERSICCHLVEVKIFELPGPIPRDLTLKASADCPAHLYRGIIPHGRVIILNHRIGIARGDTAVQVNLAIRETTCSVDQEVIGNGGADAAPHCPEPLEFFRRGYRDRIAARIPIETQIRYKNRAGEGVAPSLGGRLPVGFYAVDKHPHLPIVTSLHATDHTVETVRIIRV